jgi:hypothetical protein
LMTQAAAQAPPIRPNSRLGRLQKPTRLAPMF